MADSEGRGHILVVEDDPILRELLVGVLADSGYTALSAADAHAAMEILARQPVDLVVTDKNLPGVDGHALIDEIWTLHPRVGTVMVTGYPSSESEAQARQQHVLAYLEKPVHDLALVPQAIEAALELQRKRLGTA